MAGETVKCNAVCLAIYPWSRTSHVVLWLTRSGPVKTVVKGAVRPKSAFLGQYDLNYTCEIVYYLRERGNLHVLRECVPLSLREPLRANFRALALAGYVRSLLGELSPGGSEAEAMFDLAEETLGRIERIGSSTELLRIMFDFDMALMEISGIKPDFSGYGRSSPWSSFSLASGIFDENCASRKVRIERDVAMFMCGEKNASRQILLDAIRVIGVFYQFHLDCAVDVRREVLKLISQNENEKVETYNEH